MSLGFYAGAVALVAIAGFLWYWKNRQLAATLFGTDCRLRYVQRRWVIEGDFEGISVHSRNGFQRLDGLTTGTAPVASSGRVTWLHPGTGLLLRRYTRLGGDPEFVRQDIQLLITLMREMHQCSAEAGPLL